MLAKVFDFFDSKLRGTLRFVKWDADNRENRHPNKRSLEEYDEERENGRIKVRRTDSSHLSPYLSKLMEEDIHEIITVPDNEDHESPSDISKIVSPESPRAKDDQHKSSTEMEGLSAGLQATPLGENVGKVKTTVDDALKPFSVSFLRPDIGIRLNSEMDLRSLPSTSRNVPSPPRHSFAMDELQREEKERYSQLLQRCTNIPVASKLTASFSQRTGFEMPKTLKLEPQKRNEIIEVDLTPDSPPTPEDLKTPPKEVLASVELKKKIDQCEAFDPNWATEISRIYRIKTRERSLHEEQIKSSLKMTETSYLLQNVLEERMRQFLRLSGHAIEEGPVPLAAEEESKLPELTEEMEMRVNSAFQRIGSPSDVLSEAFSQRITRHDIHTLTGTNWLNDEVINFYMNLLIERGKNDNYPSVYCFNTFFYPKLAHTGHASLKRWTRKIDIFAHEILIIPVHLGVHWCLACVKFKEKRVEYYDSMGGANNSCLHHILKYLEEESLDKKKKKYDTSDWTTENISDNPQQMNGSDCGMFSCMYAEFICRKAKITFTQKNMPYFRRKMAYEILTKRLLL